MPEYEDDNVFAKILRGEIPSTLLYADDEFIAIRDIAPAAPTHVLVIPKRERIGPADITSADAGWLGRMLVVASKVAADLGLAEDGYRLVMNHGQNAGQAVPHMHLHIIGGERLGPFA